jgi:hypothetical protein
MLRQDVQDSAAKADNVRHDSDTNILRYCKGQLAGISDTWANAWRLAEALRAIKFLIPDHYLGRLDAVSRTRITDPGKAADWREKVPFQHSVSLRLLLSAVLQENEALIAKRARVQSLVTTSAGPADLSWLSKHIAK